MLTYKGLFHHEARVGRRVIDNRRVDEVALFILILAAGGKDVAVLLAVVEETLDAIVLHLVLDGPDHDALLVTLADLERLGEVDHGFEHGLVDVRVDVDALGGHAHLSAVEHGAHDDSGRRLGDVDVWADDRGVVASKLECHTFQRRRTGGHDAFARRDAAGKGDLLDIGMLGHLSKASVS